MSDLVVSLPPDMVDRLESLAADMGSSLEDCARMALTEFLDAWEDHLRTVGEMDDSTSRPDFSLAQLNVAE